MYMYTFTEPYLYVNIMTHNKYIHASKHIEEHRYIYKDAYLCIQVSRCWLLYICTSRSTDIYREKIIKNHFSMCRSNDTHLKKHYLLLPHP